MKRLPNIVKCEICALDEPKALERHHIIPRGHALCTDNLDNIAVICGSCHNLVHSGKITIEGVYYTTLGRKVFWHRDGEPHFMRRGVVFHENGEVEVG